MLCIFRVLRVSNLCEHHTKAVFDLKLMVGGGEHKVVLEFGGMWVDYPEVQESLNFVFVI